MPSLSVRRAARAAGVPLLALHVAACSGDPASNSATGDTGTTSGAGMTSGSSTTTSAVTTGGTNSTNASVTNTTTNASATSGSTATSSTGATTGTSTATSTGNTTSTSGAGGSGSGTSSTTTETVSTGTTGGTPDAVVSDDFESVAAGSPPDAATWQLRLPSGGTSSIEVSAEQFHGGAQSVKVVGTGGSTLFFTENVFPLPSGVLHFRVWARFTSADWENHNAFVAASPGEESQEVRFGGQHGAYHSNIAADGDVLSPDPYESPACERCVAPVADEWLCLRGKLDFTNNNAELYVNDTLAVDSATDGWGASGRTASFPLNPSMIGFGWAIYGATSNTVYYDDLAIGYEPIACQ